MKRKREGDEGERERESDEREAMLVQDPRSMASALRRLMITNDAMLFYNQQQSLKLMIRNDPVDADTLACELAVVTDDDEQLQRVMELNNDAYVDEPGTYVIDSWSFPLKTFKPEDAAKVMAAVNAAYAVTVCPCGRYLIKDDAPMCTFCDMTSRAGERATHFCSICCEDGMEMHMTTMPCCQQLLHQRCLDTWKDKSGDDRCPLCRQ